MEFGTFMEFHPRPGEGQAQAFGESLVHVDMAEEMGLDAVWLAETHFNPQRSVLSAPLIVASAVAARTTRIKVGTAVLVLPLGNPLRIAEEVATLDHLSQGRVELGVGRSGLPGAYEGYEIPYTQSTERFYECLDIILKAWTNDRFSHRGTYHSYSDVCLVPRPYQSPHPPVRVAANSDHSFPRVGGMGFPVFIGLRGHGMARVAEQVLSYERALETAGHDGPDVSLRLPVYVAETDRDASSKVRDSFMHQLRRLGSQLASSAARAGPQAAEERAARGGQLSAITWEEALRERVAVGSPERVIERLHELRETLHLSGVVAELNAGELIPREGVAGSLRLFCEKVIPAFR